SGRRAARLAVSDSVERRRAVFSVQNRREVMMRRIVALSLMSFVLLAAAPAYAQIEGCTFFKRQIDVLVASGGAVVTPSNNDPAVILLSPGLGARCYAIFVANAD